MTCLGDNGSPLVCNGYQYGVQSFLYGKDSEVCGSPNTHSAYVFIYFYKDWILKYDKMAKFENDVFNDKHKKHENTGNLIIPYDKSFNILAMLIIYNLL